MRSDALRPRRMGRHLYRQPGGVEWKRREVRWLRPAPYLRAGPALDAGSRMAFSTSARRRWSASRPRGVAVPVGDESVIAVGGKEGQCNCAHSTADTGLAERPG